MGKPFLTDSLTANSSYNTWKRRILYKTDAVVDIYVKVYYISPAFIMGKHQKQSLAALQLCTTYNLR